MPTITETLPPPTTSPSNDPYLLSEEEMLEIIRQGEEDYRLGRCNTILPNENLSQFLDRIAEECR